MISGKKVMVCDDDESIVEMVKFILELHNFKVVTETNPLKMLVRIKEERPDALLIDIWMPVITGDLIIKQVRESGISVPIIAMSASRDGNYVALEAGANIYVDKPFDIDELIHEIEELISVG